jgi:opacity protein-like surface antigen
MKKLVLMLFVLAGFTVNAQTSVGGGVFLGNGATAIELNSEFGLADGQFTVSPSFDYYMGMPEGYSLMSFNVEGHYNFGDAEELNFYPLLGVNYLMVSYTYEGASGSVGTAALSLGGGASYAVSDSMKLVGELKYLMVSGSGGLGIHAGILFNLGE